MRNIGKVAVDKDDIVAMHRIRPKEVQIKSILLKKKNAEIKTKIMQKHQSFKKNGAGDLGGCYKDKLTVNS